MIFLYPAYDVRESISGTVELVMSPFHQFLKPAFKSPVTI